MKGHIKNTVRLVFLLTFALLVLACEEDNPNDPGPGTNPNPPQSNNNPSAISQGLLFNNAQLQTGSPPDNANLADLKINKDTINLWPGLKSRISVLNQSNIVIGGVLVLIPEAEEYYEVDIDLDESSDSVSVFYIDLDPKDLDLPYEGGIVILPIDPNGNVIDEFDHPIHIDPPFDEDRGAGPVGNGQGTCEPKLAVPYFWIYTTVDGVFDDAPGYPHTGVYETMGCCTVDDNPKSVPCLGKTPNASVVVDNQYNLVNLEFIKLFGGGDFINVLERSFNDYDPDGSDFCNSMAGYSFRSGRLNTIGKYSFSPANSYETFYNFIVHSLDISLDDIGEAGFRPRIGINGNSPDGQAFINCRFMVESWIVEGQTITRVFERQPEGENWFD